MSGARPRRCFVLFGRSSDRDALTIAEVLRQETVGGALMLAAAVLALLWANVGVLLGLLSRSSRARRSASSVALT
jgi:hypothetical protein